MDSKVKNILIVIMLLFAYPVGLLFVFFWSGWPKWAKLLSTLPLLLTVIGVLLMVVLLTRNPNKAIQQAKQQAQDTEQKLIMMSPEKMRLIDGQISADISIYQSALELYKADHQKYPDSLRDLIPVYLSEYEVNPFTKKEYEYKVSQDGLYTINTTLTDGSFYSQKSP